MFFFFSSSGGSAPARDIPMSDVIASCVADWDATLAASYDGSGQTFANATLDTAYNLNLGATGTPSTDDPTFVGTSGDADAYWTIASGDKFQIPSNPAVIANLHKTTGGTPFWIALSFFIPATTPSTENRIFNTRTTGRGISIWANPASAFNPSVTIYQEGDTGEVSYASNLAGVNLTRNANNIAIVSCDGLNLKMWINSDTANVSVPFVFNATSTAPEEALTLGNNISGGRPPVTGTQFVGCQVGTEFLTDAKATIIRDQIKLRHPNRSYA